MEIIYFTKKALSGEIIIFVLSSSCLFPPVDQCRIYNEKQTESKSKGF